MRQRTVDGILITVPTKEDCLNLTVGDLAPTCFGDMRRVVDIYARGTDVKGRAYVCYYHEMGENGRMSESMKEDEPVATIPAIQRWQRSERFPKPVEGQGAATC